jgi:serine/threonine-protein kinase
MLAPGATIDRYTVEKVLGHGGTAIVYLVRHNRLGTLHALKVLSVSSDAIRQRMETEGRVQSTMHHPNVVAVTDVFEVDGMPGLLLEYIDGPPLEDALTRYKITLPDAETLFLGIVQGVRMAHLHGLVHRDLKPANVLLAPSPDGFVPKVTDFGLAKVLAEAEAGGGHTRQGVAMGTPSYMAPEQIRDARLVDQRADIFSLGCILYDLVCGHRAFGGDNAITIYNRILEGEYLPPSAFVPDLPERIEMAIRGALITEPEERIPDCDALLRVLAGQATWAVPDPRPPSPVEQAAEMPSLYGDDAPAMHVADTRVGEALPRDAQAFEFEVTEELVPSFPEPPPQAVAQRGLVVALVSMVVALAVVLGVAGTGVGFLLGAIGDDAQDAEPVAAAAGRDAFEAIVPTDARPSPPASPVAPSLVAVDDTPTVAALEAAVRVRDAAVVPSVAAPVALPPAEPRSAPASPLTVKILTVPPTANLAIDGKDAGLRTPAKLEMPAGSHRVVVRSGEAEGAFAIDVRPGTDNKWCFAFDDATLHAGSCPR